ncbi:pentapeptide repeat-containing protein [Streptomyces durbertensis]|uniref:Pentapeptide repeat-containing protein n=1 Tax=Streptomyces durbertensis TaxID=2448886 RepID=A0ABR6EKD0_9ACTN|nr:pentapeptide repeat-containing protein [Streptomyces durbertensis]MBB1245791.1 pentapeptide repeat-containing protein [Streptomyces durbertensis]
MLFVFAIWRLPWWLDESHLSEATPGSAAVVTGMRTALVAVGAGIIAALGLFYTDRNLKHSRAVLEHSQKTSIEQAELTRASLAVTERTAQKQADLTSEQQVNDRYVKAIELLSSERPTSRLGGLYALERIMKDSPKDHDTIVKVLAAFVRQFAVEPTDPPEPSGTGSRRPAADVQAALNIIGHRPTRNEDFEIDLRHSYLHGCELTNCNFAKVDFSGSTLDNSFLTAVDFSQANFFKASFFNSSWDRVNMRSTFLNDAHFRELFAYSRIDLSHAQAAFTDWSGSQFSMGLNLKDAYLREAVFSECSGLSPAMVMEAEDLKGASFSDSILSDQRLTERIAGND